MTLVVDASATIAWLFSAERVQTARDGLRRVVEEGAIVPVIWRFEVANALRIAARRGRCTDAYATRSLNRLLQLPIAVDHESQSRVWSETRLYAARYDLTVYDAAYLEVAVRSSVPLVSLDAALLRAAAKAGVEAISSA